MVLQNNTAIQIECIIDGGERFFVPAKSKVDILIDKWESVLEIYHSYKSSRKTLFDFDNVYHIVIDSRIVITQIEADSLIDISGEIVHFDLGYAYDKFFLHSQNCRIISESCLLSNLSELKEIAHEKRKRESHADRIETFLLSGGFWSMTGLFVFFKLAFWANDWSFPWWLIFVFWVLGYLLQVLGEKIVEEYDYIKQPKLAELSKYTSIEYIVSYFANPKRNWIAGNKVDL